MGIAASAPTFDGPYRPFPLRVANVLGGAFEARRPRLDLRSLLRASKVADARLDAADDPAFIDRLEALLADANGAARLTHVGRWIVRARLANVIANRLRARQWMREHPATLGVAVDTPLFIVGQPRTGTTLLYGLLAQDPQARAPRLWEVNAPVPPPLPDGGRDDPRRVRCERDLARLHKYLPGLAIAHDVHADEPDECYPMLETSLLSPTFFLYLDIPSYWTRLKAAGADEVRATYDFFRQQIQILLARSEGRRWVSKSPAHLCFLDGLVAAFPGACVVMTHREPLESIPSLCSLAAIIRSASSDQVDARHVGGVTLDWFVEAAARAERARETIAPDRVVDLTYARLVEDPVGAVRDIYSRFEFPLTRLFERRMSDWLAANAQYRRGVHRYTLEQFGLDGDRVFAATDSYRRRYLS